MEPILVDVSRGDRAQEFKGNERLQREGYKHVLDSLTDCLGQAEKFRDPNRDKNNRIRGHNAIFVNGARGTGKTAFMLSLGHSWAEHRKEMGKATDLYFFPPVDPTLLNNSDNFLNVVVSRIYQEVYQRSQDVDRTAFWSAFDKVSESMAAEQASTDVEIRGAERLMAFGNHGKLEERLGALYQEACAALGTKAMVILVDDVDMSLDKGFQILDTVRRYLAHPLIIPVISGDIELYETLVSLHFAKELKVEEGLKTLTPREWHGVLDSGDATYLAERSRRLASEYLEKVLPLHQRVKLQLIPQLQQKPRIEVLFGPHKVDLGEVFKWTARAMSFNSNGEEGSELSFTPRTARELIQLLQTLHRKDLPWSKLDEEGWTTLDVRRKVADAARHQAEAAQNIPREYLARADLQILSSGGPRLAKIDLFNPASHPQDVTRYPLSVKRPEFLSSRTASVTQQHLKESLDQIEKAAPRALLPMPEIEIWHRDLVINGAQWRGQQDGKVRLLMSLFSHAGYYSSYQAISLLYFGRAFELLVSNLLGAISPEEIDAILLGPPYYSNFYFAPTKHVDIDVDFELIRQEEEAEQTGGSSGSIIGNPDGSTLNQEIQNWYHGTDGWLAAHPPSAKLLSMVMNKAFTQFNLYKARPRLEPGFGATLAEQIERFRLILLNSFASLESTAERVVQQNIAQNRVTSFENDQSWRQNISPLIEDKTRFSYTRLIATHPLFTLAADVGRDVLIGQNPADPQKALAHGHSEARQTYLERLYRDLPNGVKRESTERIKALLGELATATIWTTRRENSPEVAGQIIDLIRAALPKFTKEQRAVLAAQLLLSGGYPGRIKVVMRQAGRLDELIRLLLD